MASGVSLSAAKAAGVRDTREVSRPREATNGLHGSMKFLPQLNNSRERNATSVAHMVFLLQWKNCKDDM
jgi:hypothetical protein